MRKINLFLVNIFLLTGCTINFGNIPSSIKKNSSSKEEIVTSSTNITSNISSSSSNSSSSSSTLLSSSSSKSNSTNSSSTSTLISTTSSSSLTSSSSSSSNSSSSSSLSSSTNSSSSSSDSDQENEYLGELLKNNDFEDLSSWIIEPSNDSEKLQVVSNGSSSLNLKINNSSATNYWDIQVLQNELSLVEGRTYQVSFKIKSSSSRTFKFIIQKMDYSALAYEEDIYLSRNQTYEFNKDITINDSSMYLFGFMLGNVNGVNRSSHTITISNPSLNDTISEFDSYGGRKGTYTEAPQTLKNKQLVWSDEFNGTKLDENNWSYNKGAGGWGNNEYQYYTDSENNVRVVNGSLRIKAIKEEYKGSSYTSGRIDTKNKQTFKYGYFEARIALPKEMGIWPAFWMLGDNIDEVNWPRCGEIDIMEAINDENKVYSTLHWNNYGVSGDDSHTYIGNDEGYNVENREEYHVYAVDWSENRIRTYVDNVEVFSYSLYSSTSQEAFRNEFYFLLNVAVGGNWPGFEIGDNFPQTMSVDYIRVYQ